jgi:hypothetical protein
MEAKLQLLLMSGAFIGALLPCTDEDTDIRKNRLRNNTGLDYYQFTIVSEVKTKTNNIVGYKICVVKLPVSSAELST